MSNVLEIGPPTWRFIHSMAALVDKKKKKYASLFADMILLMCIVFPCIHCRKSFSKIFISNYDSALSAHEALLSNLQTSDNQNETQRIAYELHKSVTEHITADHNIPYIAQRYPTEKNIIDKYTLQPISFSTNDLFTILILYTFDYHPGDGNDVTSIQQMKFFLTQFMKVIELLFGMEREGAILKKYKILEASIYSFPDKLLEAIYNARKEVFPNDNIEEMKKVYESFKTKTCETTEKGCV